MTIILPLILVSLLIGLSARKMSKPLWFAAALAIVLVMTNAFLKN